MELQTNFDPKALGTPNPGADRRPPTSKSQLAGETSLPVIQADSQSASQPVSHPPTNQASKTPRQPVPERICCCSMVRISPSQQIQTGFLMLPMLDHQRLIGSSAWLWLAAASCGWLLMPVAACGCLRLTMAGSGWLLLAVASQGWLWLAAGCCSRSWP